MKIPYVKAKDSDSNTVVEGFYFEYPETTYCFTEDYIREPKVRLIPCVMSYRMTDWGLPNEPTICRPIDKSTLEIIGYIDTENDYYIPQEYKKETTQSDYLRTLSDKDLASFLHQVALDTEDTISYGSKQFTEVWDYEEDTLEWLQSKKETDK